MQIVIEESVARIKAAKPRHGRRVFHGRGHTYPGFEHIVVTWLPPYLLISTFKPVAGGEHFVRSDIDALSQAICEQLPSVQGICWQQRDGRRTYTEVVWGDVPAEHVVEEAGLSYQVFPTQNQNIGLFMDMGHVREHLAQYMPGARVLNLFSYTCAFSVSAIAHGAVTVVNNDMSKNALRIGNTNHELNNHDLRNVRMLPHNLFKSWWKIRQLGPYDVVIIDPPTNQRGSFVAEKSYGQVLKRLGEFMNPGGRVIACLNSPFLGPEFLTAQMQRWCPQAQLQGFLPAHPDFPDKFPERGLKVAEFIL